MVISVKLTIGRSQDSCTATRPIAATCTRRNVNSGVWSANADEVGLD